MRNRKIISRFTAAALLAAAVSVMASGCTKKEDPAQTTEAVSTVSAETQATEPESTEDPRTMPELKSEDEIGILCGTVKDASMNTVVVANKEYPDGVAFSKEDAAVSFEEGLLLDEEVTIFYRGKIEPASSAGIKAELVRDARDGDEELEAGAVSGEILAIGMSVITIQTKEGTEVSFEQDPKPVILAKKVVEGETVTIIYSHKKGETIYVPELIQGESES